MLSLQLMRGCGDNGGREQLQHAANQPMPMWYGSDIEVLAWKQSSQLPNSTACVGSDRDPTVRRQLSQDRTQGD